MIPAPTTRRVQAATLAGCLVVALALGGVAGATSAVGTGATGATAGAASETTLTVGDATLEPDETAAVRVALDRVPEGIAGFQISLSLDAEGVATVTGARYPEGYQPTTDPTTADSGTTVTLEAADLGSAVEPGATNVTLAFVSLTGVEDGAATLTATDVQIDGDDGSKVGPAVDGGTVSVSAGRDGTGGESTAVSGQRGTGSTTAATGGVPRVATGIGVGLLAVVLGLVGLGLLVYRG